MRLLSCTLGAFLSALVLVGNVGAQVFTPTFTSPRLLNEVGVTVSDGPGNLTFEGIWRGGPLGLRLGFVDGRGGLISVGGELRSPVQITGAPMGLAFTAAAQGLLGDENAVGAHAGLSAGYTFTGNGLAITPYLHPRIGLVNNLGEGDELELQLLADLGTDVEFWNNILVRVGVKLDDVGSSWGIGLGWRR
ncbi:hypothetical protein BH23GEM3_BH23GEM3_23090 [soil metagenome]